MSDHTTKKRLTRFAMLLVFVAFLAACLWGRAQLVWVNERREVTNLEDDDPGNIVIAVSFGGGWPAKLKTATVPLAPWPVRFLGEGGVATIWIDSRVPTEKKVTELARLQRLFPEAKVTEAPPQMLRARPRRETPPHGQP